MQLQISSRRETGKEITESSRLELLGKFLAKILLYQMQKATPPGPLNRGGMADLALLRTLSAICQMFQGPTK